MPAMLFSDSRLLRPRPLGALGRRFESCRPDWDLSNAEKLRRTKREQFRLALFAVLSLKRFLMVDFWPN
ncbi:Hypothetical protein P9211_05971 [Prochlorococcus marinus str. MIT 9211]|uniref:Uncharacterized protein n=1 Tax=Prochlorococcus marinus (strain MIT 9211) TaxID=93059 RepID=A9BEL8_PROM4|nr:Hypothetical protein P9211_05971 [Prochlorococcus marinus str. MIT 9211]